MVVLFDELKEYRGRVGMVDGAFDPLHQGHIEYFRAAAELGVPLLCNVASDAYVRTKHPPLLPAAHRVAVVDAIRYITYTHLYVVDTETTLRELIYDTESGGPATAAATRLPTFTCAAAVPAAYRCTHKLRAAAE